MKKTKITVYGIGGKLSPGPSGDCLVGTAYDLTTLNSLLNFVRMKGGYAVSLHGVFDGNIISGEYSLADAFLLLVVKEKQVSIETRVY